MWCCQRLSNRTNNRCESFHSEFVKTFPVHSGRPSFGEVVNSINILLTNISMKNDSHPSRTSQLEMENRAIERILMRYSDCLDADDLFTCLEKLAERKTDLSIDLDEIRSRVSQSSLGRREIDLDAEPDCSKS